jgi:hypothetical protein
MRRMRDADAERVGREPRVGAAPRRDQRPRQHVDEVHGHETLPGALLGPAADAREVMRVGEPGHAYAGRARPLDRDRHRLLADDLAESSATVHADQRAMVGDDARRLPGPGDALAQVVDVARQEADAVRVVAEEVGLDESVGHRPRLLGRAAGGRERRRGGFGERHGVDVHDVGRPGHRAILSCLLTITEVHDAAAAVPAKAGTRRFPTKGAGSPLVRKRQACRACSHSVRSG